MKCYPKEISVVLAGVLVAAALTGCDDGDYDYEPAEGMAVLVVDNRTDEGDIDVYVGGRKVMRVDNLDDDGVDVEPGLQRVVLMGRDDSRTYARSVDFLEGRQTILFVTVEQGYPSDYDVDIDYD